MSKFKVKLGRLPDFKLPVTATLPNGQEGTITFIVRHMKAEEIQELFSKAEATDVEFLEKLCSGWDLEEEFNEENRKELISLYPGFVVKLVSQYVQALAGNRVKN